MSTTMNDLVGIVRFQIRDICDTQVFPDVVDHSLVPPAVVANNSPELTMFVQDALGEFSRYRPLLKPITLNVVRGQTQYALPSDWMTADLPSFESAAQPERVPDPLEFALPYVKISPALGAQQNTLRFEWYDDLQQLVLSDAPIADYTLRFSYYATQTPATLPAQWRNAAMMVAAEKALRAIATDQAVKLQKYRVAYNIEVDNQKIAEHLLKQADAYRERFRREVVMRPHGSMGKADVYGNWM